MGWNQFAVYVRAVSKDATRNATIGLDHIDGVFSGIAANLRLSPEHYATAKELFSGKLDQDKSGDLSKVEFVDLVRPSHGNNEKMVRVSRDVFSYFAPNGVMDEQQFLRFFAAVIIDPRNPGAGSFEFHKGELVDLSENEKSCLMKLFVVFDENSDGDVDKVEFQNEYKGPLLQELRKQGLLRCGPKEWQLELASGELQDDEVLSLDGFYKLTARIAKEGRARPGSNQNSVKSTCSRLGSASWIVSCLALVFSGWCASA